MKTNVHKKNSALKLALRRRQTWNLEMAYPINRKTQGAPLTQWWEHLSPTNVAWARSLDSESHVGWICWFSSLLRAVFLWVLRFSPLLKTNLQFDFCAVSTTISAPACSWDTSWHIVAFQTKPIDYFDDTEAILNYIVPGPIDIMGSPVRKYILIICLLSIP